jgi:tetratricopeptide (TPR) repeat protein
LSFDDAENLGALYQDQGRYDEARSLYEQCLQIFENAFGKKHMDVARSNF